MDICITVITLNNINIMGLLINGQVGWRTAAVIGAPAAASTLWTSVYGVWNADGTNNLSVKNAWNANGNAVDSKSGANGTIAAPSGNTWVPSTMTYGSGKVGSSAFTFNGSNFINLPNNTLNFTSDFTVSMWVYLPNTTGFKPLISSFDNSAGTTNGKGWIIYSYDGLMQFQVATPTNKYYTISVPMSTANQWVHIAVTKQVGQQGNIYINGVAGTKTVISGGGMTSSENPTYQSKAYIGAYYSLGSNPEYNSQLPTGAKIDAIQTWDGTALDQTAVTELYNSGNGQEYPFTTSNALIASPNDAVSTNHGTLVNGTTFTDGKIGKAFTFDGINDYVALPNNIMKFSNTDNWSVSFWIYQTAGVYSGVIGNNAYIGGQGTGWGIRTWTSGSNPSKFSIQFFTNWVNGSGTPLNILQTDGATNINEWNHFVITRNSSAQEKIYQNGTLVASQTNSSTKLTYPATSYSNIGVNRYDSTGFEGYAKAGSKIDAMSVWNKELSATEITELYNAGTGKQYPN